MAPRSLWRVSTTVDVVNDFLLTLGKQCSFIRATAGTLVVHVWVPPFSVKPKSLGTKSYRSCTSSYPCLPLSIQTSPVVLVEKSKCPVNFCTPKMVLPSNDNLCKLQSSHGCLLTLKTDRGLLSHLLLRYLSVVLTSDPPTNPSRTSLGSLSITTGLDCMIVPSPTLSVCLSVCLLPSPCPSPQFLLRVQ